MATVVQLVDLYGLSHEILMRVANGSLHPERVKESFQALVRYTDVPQWSLPRPCVDPSKLTPPPPWWRSAEQQLARAEELWPYLELPEVPTNFVPASRTEVLLLHVPRPFDELWDAIAPPEGYTKSRWHMVKPGRIRLTENVPDRRRPVWLGFDYESYVAEPPSDLCRQPDLAANEVLSAVIQFPDWLFTESTSTAWPHIAGYVASRNGTYWRDTPYLTLRTDGPVRDLRLSQRPPYTFQRLRGQWVSPSVREL